MDYESYALLNKQVKSAVSGVASMSVEGTNLIINTNDGNTLTMTFPTPSDGVSVIGAHLDENNQLVLEMSNGATIDAGQIQTAEGKPGAGVPAGGISGQVLGKNSDEDYDTTWFTLSAMDSGSSGASNVYSTEETVIGTWIDEKPLYRKVYYVTTPATENVNTVVVNGVLATTKMDVLVNMYGVIQSSTVTPNSKSVLTDRTEDGFGASVYISQTGAISIRVGKGTITGYYCNQPCYVIIEYTKTTDTATTALPTSEEMIAAYEEGVQSA